MFPTVHQVDQGVARDLIAPTLPADLAAAGAVILRVATQSMLQDDPTFAPYGWTHCLTLPQAVLSVRPWLADATRSTAIAATYVVAFRAAEGARDIDIEWRPEPTRVPLDDALDGRSRHRGERGVPRARRRARGLGARRSRRGPRRTKTRTSRSTRSRASPRPRPTRRSGGCTSRPRRISRAWWKAFAR